MCVLSVARKDCFCQTAKDSTLPGAATTTARTVSIRPTIPKMQLSQTGTGTIERSSYGKQIRNKVCWSRLSRCPDHTVYCTQALRRHQLELGMGSLPTVDLCSADHCDLRHCCDSYYNPEMNTQKTKGGKSFPPVVFRFF